MIAKRNTLYLIARTDLDTMTSGRIAAQVSHAANAFQYMWPDDYDRWCKSAGNDLPFGTVIVLDGKNDMVLEKIDVHIHKSGLVIDPTYPIRDGEKVHYVGCLTCAYAYVEEDFKVPKIIKKLKLL